MNSEALFCQSGSLLIIDRYPYWLTFAANTLQMAGYRVYTINSYEDILPELSKGQTFNLVILGCANVALAERLLITHLLTQHLHLIVLAKTLPSGMIRTLFLQGVDDVVEKTHDSTRLLSYVDQVIQRIA
jgi:DNA-binding NtrC family response regulator